MLNKHTIEELLFPVDGYRFIVKTFTSIDGGTTYYYCGNSQYFKTLEDAEAYKTILEKESEGAL